MLRNTWLLYVCAFFLSASLCTRYMKNNNYCCVSPKESGWNKQILESQHLVVWIGILIFKNKQQTYSLVHIIKQTNVALVVGLGWWVGACHTCHHIYQYTGYEMSTVYEQRKTIVVGCCRRRRRRRHGDLVVGDDRHAIPPGHTSDPRTLSLTRHTINKYSTVEAKKKCIVIHVHSVVQLSRERVVFGVQREVWTANGWTDTLYV